MLMPPARQLLSSSTHLLHTSGPRKLKKHRSKTAEAGGCVRKAEQAAPLLAGAEEQLKLLVKAVQSKPYTQL